MQLLLLLQSSQPFGELTYLPSLFVGGWTPSVPWHVSDTTFSSRVPAPHSRSLAVAVSLVLCVQWLAHDAPAVTNGTKMTYSNRVVQGHIPSITVKFGHNVHYQGISGYKFMEHEQPSHWKWLWLPLYLSQLPMEVCKFWSRPLTASDYRKHIQNASVTYCNSSTVQCLQTLNGLDDEQVILLQLRHRVVDDVNHLQLATLAQANDVIETNTNKTIGSQEKPMNNKAVRTSLHYMQKMSNNFARSYRTPAFSQALHKLAEWMISSTERQLFHPNQSSIIYTWKQSPLD